MPKLVVTHEVDDVPHWLASPKRAEIFAGVATNLTTYVMPNGSNLVAVTLDVEDMDAFDALMKSDAAAAAKKHDGVRSETMKMFMES